MAIKIVPSENPDNGDFLIAETDGEIAFLQAIRGLDQVATGYMHRVMRAMISDTVTTEQVQYLSKMPRTEMFAYIDQHLPA